ncbi:MAG: hypothetical protein K0S25_1572, partial [Bacillus sp. (in: firmicutes)]|nr:hypothetical protein [Bacillus sp. (in: firmicutes)]
TGARFQQSLWCGESELPMEMKEIIESSLAEKRKHPQSIKDFSFMDFP